MMDPYQFEIKRGNDDCMEWFYAEADVEALRARLQAKHENLALKLIEQERLYDVLHECIEGKEGWREQRETAVKVMEQQQQEIARLRRILMSVSRVLQDPETTGINDTIWLDDLTTLVEHIETTLAGTKEGA